MAWIQVLNLTSGDGLLFEYLRTKSSSSNRRQEGLRLESRPSFCDQDERRGCGGSTKTVARSAQQRAPSVLEYPSLDKEPEVTSEVPENLCPTGVDNTRPARSPQFSLSALFCPLPQLNVDFGARYPPVLFHKLSRTSYGGSGTLVWTWWWWRTTYKNDSPKAARVIRRSRVF